MESAKKLSIPIIISAAVVLSVAGIAAISALQANAQTATTTTAAVADTAVNPANTTPPAGTPGISQPDPSKGGHVGSNGTKEELLTGDTAEKVKAAALASVAGGTVERVETDAEGAAYEAHVKKSDGTQVTVKFDSNFKVTSTEDGMR